jgi:hypothetical protein
MSFKPNVQTRAQNSQASPLANDVLKMIQGQISGGTMGGGFSPLERQAGTAIQQVVNSGMSNTVPVVRDIGPAGANFGKMIADLEAVHGRNVNRGAADMREQAGIAGTRYGSTLATGEGRFRAGANQDFNVQAGQMAMALDEARRADTQVGIQRDVAAGQLAQGQQDELLRSIMAMFQMGQGAMAPIFQMAGAGILPEHLMVSPGMGPQLLSGLMQLAGVMAPVAGQWMQNRRPATA